MKRILISLVVAVLVVSCANRGNGPQGGLRDNTAPVFVSAFPSSGATRYDGKSIEIEFDEYVQLVNAQSAVTISPLQQRLPSYSASGRKVRVELNDTLKPNTTYSIDFSDAIRDINESNSLKNFHYTFSTGESLDTMEVSGVVLNAADLEPVKGMLVGLYPLDSLFNDTILRHASAKYEVNMYTSRYKQYPHASKKSITNPLAKDVLYVVAQYKDSPVKVNTGWAEAIVKDMHNGTGTPLSSAPYLSSAKEVGLAVSGSTAQALLSSLKAGDTVRLKFDMSIEGETKPISTQNSSMYRLMEDGKDGSNTPPAGNNLLTTYDPMTFPVVSQDRKTVWLVEVDGRQAGYSYGVKSYEMFRIAQKLGGWNVTRFDGGGSSCMWVYDPSASSGKIVNRVSDSKGERSCLNYMLVRIK